MIHSFISNIYIAPLQENYSEALPTPARPKRAVLMCEKNIGEKVLGKRRSSRGRPFQVEGPTTKKARFCIVEVRAKGTSRRPCLYIHLSIHPFIYPCIHPLYPFIYLSIRIFIHTS